MPAALNLFQYPHLSLPDDEGGPGKDHSPTTPGRFSAADPAPERAVAGVFPAGKPGSSAECHFF